MLDIYAYLVCYCDYQTLFACSLLELAYKACQQVYLLYHAGACMPLPISRLLHLLSLATYLPSFCLHVWSSTSILVYFPT